VINANLFLYQVHVELKAYISLLRESPWESKTWSDCRTKMNVIIGNCAG
jgi:hypothetical protein